MIPVMLIKQHYLRFIAPSSRSRPKPIVLQKHHMCTASNRLWNLGCRLFIIGTIVSTTTALAQSQPAADKLDEIEKQVKALQKLVEEMRSADEDRYIVKRDRDGDAECIDFDGRAGG